MNYMNFSFLSIGYIRRLLCRTRWSSQCRLLLEMRLQMLRRIQESGLYDSHLPLCNPHVPLLGMCVCKGCLLSHLVYHTSPGSSGSQLWRYEEALHNNHGMFLGSMLLYHWFGLQQYQGGEQVNPRLVHKKQNHHGQQAQICIRTVLHLEMTLKAYGGLNFWTLQNWMIN